MSIFSFSREVLLNNMKNSFKKDAVLQRTLQLGLQSFFIWTPKTQEPQCNKTLTFLLIKGLMHRGCNLLSLRAGCWLCTSIARWCTGQAHKLPLLAAARHKLQNIGKGVIQENGGDQERIEGSTFTWTTHTPSLVFCSQFPTLLSPS